MTEDESILICAFRYCLGRRSYVVAECDGWIRNHWPTMGVHARSIILADLKTAIEDETRILGMEQDRKIWVLLYEDLKT